MTGHFETRWALMVGGDLLGIYCWNGGQADDQPRVRTFRTRKLALDAKQLLNSYKREARVVKAKVTIE